MRATTIVPVLSLFLAVGCGGDSSPSGPKDPPSTPASITVVSGDAQQGEPGKALGAEPVVVVRKADGGVVSGATVTFTVESGGGSIERNSAVTAANGTASPGKWTLGAAEGANVLLASAAAGVLVKVNALAVTPGAASVPDQTVGIGGGRLLIQQPGAPIDGLEIALAAGTFTGSQTIGISYAATHPGFTAPQGTTLISPVITFRASDGSFARKPFLLAIPAAVPAGTFPAILLRDPASGRQAILPTVYWDRGSVVAQTTHLNTANLPGASISSSLIAAAQTQAGGLGTAAVIAIPEALLAPEHDTGFRPGIDSWEHHSFDNTVVADIDYGLVATAAWYYVNRKATGGSLWKKYQKAANVDYSNRTSVRWATATQVATAKDFAETSSGTIDMLNGIRIVEKEGSPVVISDLRRKMTVSAFNALRTALLLQPNQPQMAILSQEVGPGLAILVYRSNGTNLYAVNPGNPGQTITLNFTGDQMGPVTLSGYQGTFTRIHSEAFLLMGAETFLQSSWPKVENGTIGDDLFKTYRLMMSWGPTVADQAEVSDLVHVFDEENPVTIWADCITCTGDLRPPQLPVGTAAVASLGTWDAPTPAGPYTDRGQALAVQYSQQAAGDRSVGMLIMSRAGAALNLSWLDWKSVTVRRLAATIAPTSPSTQVNSDLTLTLTVTNPPANLEYEWDFDDNTAKVVTTTAQATHKWTTDGTFTTKVTARDRTTKVPVAKAKVDVAVGPPLNVWKFTSVTVTVDRGTLPAGIEGSSIEQDMFRGDSLRFTRMRDGVSQGAIQLVESELTRNCTPQVCGATTLRQGLYLLEYSTIDRDALKTPFVLLTSPSGPPAVPTRLNGWTLVRVLPHPENPCTNTPGQSFARTGDGTTGTVKGAYARYCVNITTTSRNLNMMNADVTIAGDNATGTLLLEVPYYTYDVNGVVNGTRGTKKMTVTFAAKRVP